MPWSILEHPGPIWIDTSHQASKRRLWLSTCLQRTAGVLVRRCAKRIKKVSTDSTELLERCDWQYCSLLINGDIEVFRQDCRFQLLKFGGTNGHESGMVDAIWTILILTSVYGKSAVTTIWTPWEHREIAGLEPFHPMPGVVSKQLVRIAMKWKESHLPSSCPVVSECHTSCTSHAIDVFKG